MSRGLAKVKGKHGKVGIADQLCTYLTCVPEILVSLLIKKTKKTRNLPEYFYTFLLRLVFQHHD